MEEDALVANIPYDLFWGDMTPKLLHKYTKAYSRQQQDKDQLNYLLGQYVSVGHHNLKEYPKQPYLADKKIEPKAKDMTDSAMQLEAQRIAIMFGGEIK